MLAMQNCQSMFELKYTEKKFCDRAFCLVKSGASLLIFLFEWSSAPMIGSVLIILATIDV